MVKTGIILLSITLSVNMQAAGRYNEIRKYDRYFEEYSRKYFGPEFDWRYFKAQAIVESGLDPDAKSLDGALGIMQVLPATFDEIREKNPIDLGNEKTPQWNIAAGIFYDRILWETWDSERSTQERIKFMFGSYNAGKKDVLKAQDIAIEKGLNPYKWESIEKTLPEIIGESATETIDYVKEINLIYKVLK